MPFKCNSFIAKQTVHSQRCLALILSSIFNHGISVANSDFKTAKDAGNGFLTEEERAGCLTLIVLWLSIFCVSPSLCNVLVCDCGLPWSY